MADTSETNSLLALPNIRRIRNIAEFMAQPDNSNAGIEMLTDRMTLQLEKCRLVEHTLKEQIQLKTKAMRTIKADLLQLQQRLCQPDAINRFVVEDEKIPLKFSDQSEPMLLPLGPALDQYSMKMGTLFCEILAINGDVDYVVYLKSIAVVNEKAVRDWFARKHAKKGDSYVHFDVNYFHSQDDSTA